jgi:hypothetical protein
MIFLLWTLAFVVVVGFAFLAWDSLKVPDLNSARGALIWSAFGAFLSLIGLISDKSNPEFKPIVFVCVSLFFIDGIHYIFTLKKTRAKI